MSWVFRIVLAATIALGLKTSLLASWSRPSLCLSALEKTRVSEILENGTREEKIRQLKEMTEWKDLRWTGLMTLVYTKQADFSSRGYEFFETQYSYDLELENAFHSAGIAIVELTLELEKVIKTPNSQSVPVEWLAFLKEAEAAAMARLNREAQNLSLVFELNLQLLSSIEEAHLPAQFEAMSEISRKNNVGNFSRLDKHLPQISRTFGHISKLAEIIRKSLQVIQWPSPDPTKTLLIKAMKALIKHQAASVRRIFEAVESWKKMIESLDDGLTVDERVRLSNVLETFNVTVEKLLRSKMEFLIQAVRNDQIDLAESLLFQLSRKDLNKIRVENQSLGKIAKSEKMKELLSKFGVE